MKNNIALIEKTYESFAARDYEAVMSNFADDVIWVAAENSPLADQSPYHGVEEIRNGVFKRIAAGFEKLVVVADEIYGADGGRVLVLGYYHGKFRGATDEFKTQVAHIWTIRDGQAIKFQQYLDTLKVARDSGSV
jgi:ketosteroid isomerase-like protein